MRCLIALFVVGIFATLVYAGPQRDQWIRPGKKDDTNVSPNNRELEDSSDEELGYWVPLDAVSTAIIENPGSRDTRPHFPRPGKKRSYTKQSSDTEFSDFQAPFIRPGRKRSLEN
ncbi:uncharacterized protein [Montipora foliosa]|uniref:uncharacterized protein n=1 Tax=Montipora foliosa TaxID=591990 RepID=UPI0035F2128C